MKYAILFQYFNPFPTPSSHIRLWFLILRDVMKLSFFHVQGSKDDSGASSSGGRSSAAAAAGSTGSENKAKLQKVLKDINKQISNPGSGVWPDNKVAALDRSLGELHRLFARAAAAAANASANTSGGPASTALNEVSGSSLIICVCCTESELEKSDI